MSGLALLERLIAEYSSYARLDEVQFNRADALSDLARWSEAATAWRATPPPADAANVAYRLHRLAEALAPDGRCAEALELLSGHTEPWAEARRRQCQPRATPPP
ncbi:MAG: hypothetical protein ACOZQL_41340 [Myxococcota bacterium]